MKMKRLWSWLLVLAMCFALVACGKKQTQKPDTTVESSETETTEQTQETTDSSEEITQPGSATPLLYRVSDDDGNVVWLFGSIHVGREDYYPLPSYITDAFDGADSLAVELDIIAFEKSIRQQREALSLLVYADGSTIEDHLSEELYSRAVNALEELDYYMSALDYYCPAFWSSAIDSLLMEEMDADIDLGLDRYLLEQAKDSKKEILEIESAEFQYQMMADFSDELQSILLEASLETYDDVDAANDELVKLMDVWASGDEQAFAEVLSETGEMTAQEEKLYEEYNQAMVVERNLAMADFAEDALLSGEEVFICVGAAHVVGEGAMAQLLAQRGYTVECITQ